MELSTLTQIKTRLQNDCDIQDEDFMDLDTELLGLINSAIDTAEASIHNLYEDYFLVRSTFTWVNGTQSYSLPSDIYANKIRHVVYVNGTTKYEIKRIRRPLECEFINTGELYRYILTNDSTNGVKALFYPTPTESGTNAKIWYIRNAKKLTQASDSCDIPEFINFIYCYVKWQIARKEKSQVDLATSKEEFLFQKDLMEKTLSNMVPDEGNEVIPDTSFYDDFDTQISDVR